MHGGRAAFWPQHAHQALGGNPRAPFEVCETDRCVDIIAENCLTSREVSVNDALEGSPKTRRPQLRTARRPRRNCFFEVVTPRNYQLLSRARRCTRRLEPIASAI